MTTWFISRHPGALQWAQQQGLQVDRYVAHLDAHLIEPEDTVIGSLPVNLAADVCSRGARYLHLSLELPAHFRGQELTAEQLNALGAKIQAFHIQPISTDLL
jgi:CRISPR-associated protein Csx16